MATDRVGAVVTTNQTDAHFARLVTIDGPPLPPDARPACTEQPDLFFAEAGGGGDYTAPRRAKALCHACPWRVDCFTWAADPANQVRDGVWGGVSFSRASPDEQFIKDYRRTHHPKETAA